MTLQPPSYEAALAKRRSKPEKARKPLTRTKSLRRSIQASKSVSGAIPGKVAARKKRAKRTKLPSRKSLVRKLDSLVSQIVRLRDGRCVVTGSTDQLGCGHLFSRRSLSTRWDVSENGNCHAQSWPSNFRHTHDSQPYTRWFIGKFGLEAYDALYARYRQGKKWSRLELIELAKELEIKLASLS